MNDYIDPDRVRELARLHRKWGEEGAWAPKTESPHTQIADALESLLTPSRPTLADLFEEGHDLAQFHWMQADVLTQGETFRVVITRTVDKSLSAVTVSPAGYAVAYDQSLVTPLPDLPRLVWPASEQEPAEETPTPEVLVTEEDYENAPSGTICAEDGYFPLYTNVGTWLSASGIKYDHRHLAGTPRRVLRWGVGEQA